MKVKFPKPANHGPHNKTNNGKEKMWIKYSNDNDDTVEIEIEVDLEKEKLYNETITLYDKKGFFIHYFYSDNTIDKLV